MVPQPSVEMELLVRVEKLEAQVTVLQNVLGPMKGGAAMQAIEKLKELPPKWRNHHRPFNEDIGDMCADEVESMILEIEAEIAAVTSAVEEIGSLKELMACGHPKVCLGQPYCGTCGSRWGSEEHIEKQKGRKDFCGNQIFKQDCTACQHERLAVAAALERVAHNFDNLYWTLKNKEAAEAVRKMISPADRSALDAYGAQASAKIFDKFADLALSLYGVEDGKHTPASLLQAIAAQVHNETITEQAENTFRASDAHDAEVIDRTLEIYIRAFEQNWVVQDTIDAIRALKGSK